MSTTTLPSYTPPMTGDLTREQALAEDLPNGVVYLMDGGGAYLSGHARLEIVGYMNTLRRELAVLTAERQACRDAAGELGESAERRFAVACANDVHLQTLATAAALQAARTERAAARDTRALASTACG